MGVLYPFQSLKRRRGLHMPGAAPLDPLFYEKNAHGSEWVKEQTWNPYFSKFCRFRRDIRPIFTFLLDFWHFFEILLLN